MHDKRHYLAFADQPRSFLLRFGRVVDSPSPHVVVDGQDLGEMLVWEKPYPTEPVPRQTPPASRTGAERLEIDSAT